MKKVYFEIKNDFVIKHTSMLEIGENAYKTEVVMNKEIFQECYKKWVEPQESCDTCKHKDEEWDSEPCDGCCGNHSGFETQERSDKE